jgi:hypothetical protein
MFLILEVDKNGNIIALYTPCSSRVWVIMLDWVRLIVILLALGSFSVAATVLGYLPQDLRDRRYTIPTAFAVGGLSALVGVLTSLPTLIVAFCVSLTLSAIILFVLGRGKD